MDDFDRWANIIYNRQVKFRGDYPPSKPDDERIAKGKSLEQQHIKELARLMRERGSAAKFRNETSDLHGGHPEGLPFDLELKFHDIHGQLTGNECWDLTFYFRKKQPPPWPGTASNVEPEAGHEGADEENLPTAQQSIHEALQKAFPEGIPKMQKVAIQKRAGKQLQKYDAPVPSDSTFQRYFKSNHFKRFLSQN